MTYFPLLLRNIKVIRSTGGLNRNAICNKWHHWSQVISFSNVIMQVIMVMYQIFSIILWYWVILFRGYMIHNLLFCLAHFALLANVIIIFNCRKLQEYHNITGRYTQWQCVPVNKWKRKYKKKSHLSAHGLFYTTFNSQ